jgi:hypothetical protein
VRANLLLIMALLASACASDTSPTTPSTLPATFTMTWSTLAFSSTGVGTTAATPVVITLWNTGASAVPVASVTDTNSVEFPWTTSCSLSGSLAPNSTCAVTAQFVPDAMGAQTATLTINANSAAQTFRLTGTGVPLVSPHVSVTPAAGSASTVFAVSMTGMTPSGTLTLNTAYTPAQGNPDIPFSPTTWTADASGALTISSTSDAPGTYDNWVVDTASGLSSNHVLHTIM